MLFLLVAVSGDAKRRHCHLFFDVDVSTLELGPMRGSDQRMVR
jgi:hypothetical protein